MSRDVIIHDIRGRRTCTDADFPLRVGRGSEADIRLPDGGVARTFALIGRSDAHVFVQPATGAPPVLHNDAPVSESTWLEHGDTLVVAGTRVHFDAGATSIAFTVETGVVTPEVTPPSAPPPAAPADGRESGARPRRASGGLRAVKGIAVGLFVLLILAAAFVFLATPIAVRISPAPDRLSIDGFWPAVEVGGRLLVLPGDYRVTASKTGYRPLNETVPVEGADPVVLDYTLEKLPGLVTFVVRPEVTASVRLDGETLGTTPIVDMEIRPGEHVVEVTADRYAPASLAVDVRGLGERQSVEVTLLPLWAEIDIVSRPGGARVLLDGESIGETPLTAEILEGSYQLSLEREGFDTVNTVLHVVANEHQTLPEFGLVESDGLVVLETTPAGANVTVDGEFRGRTPVELSLSPHERHLVRITRAGYEAVERRMQVEPASTKSLSIPLEPRYGTIFITVVPVDAELYVDGRRHGPATGRVRLTTRRHRLAIRKEGYEPFETTVTPRAGVSQELSVTLKTVAQAKKAARKPVIETSQGQTLKLVEPARFKMGASRREQGRRANESQRLVEITRAFYLGIHEVTNEQFKQFKSDHGSGRVRAKSLDEPEQPVVRVTWEDAVRYLNWLSARDGLPPAYVQSGGTFAPVDPPNAGYRLPTEAEWAYVARYAGRSSPSKYPWGGSFPPTGSAGNYADTSAATLLPNTLSDYGDGYMVSAPVGKFAPVGPGFFDLGGNVAEWVQDFYGVYPGAAKTLATDPAGPATGRHHVVRGSSWRHGSISELRLTYRDYSEKERDDLGFRIARYAD